MQKEIANLIEQLDVIRAHVRNGTALAGSPTFETIDAVIGHVEAAQHEWLYGSFLGVPGYCGECQHDWGDGETLVHNGQCRHGHNTGAQ